MMADSGTYALLLRAEGEREIEIGALGTMTVSPGVYVYVGSAFGPGGLRARVERHVRGDGARHWHVDYLRAATVPLDGFGASDCNCPAHLARFTDGPSLERFRNRIHARVDDHSAVCCTNGGVLS